MVTAILVAEQAALNRLQPVRNQISVDDVIGSAVVGLVIKRNALAVDDPEEPALAKCFAALGVTQNHMADLMT